MASAAQQLAIVSPRPADVEEDQDRYNAAVVQSALKIIMREKGWNKTTMAERMMLTRRTFYNLMRCPRLKTLRFEALMLALTEIRAGWR